MDSTEKSLDDLTFADLRVHYGTGRAFLIRQEYRRNVYGYRKGVKTDLGDLEEKDWIQLATGLIQKSGEQQLQKNLLEWEQEHNYCNSSLKEMEVTALELHMARIFDDPLWVAYIPFNRKYRPEVLESARLVWVQTECCGVPGQITQEQLDKSTGNALGITCPICGRCSLYKRPDPVTVELVKDETLTVNVHNDKVTVDVPKTGDNFNPWIGVGLIAASTAGLGASIFWAKKRKKKAAK